MARRLAGEGIATLGELIAFCNRRGRRWWRRVPRIGAGRARAGRVVSRARRTRSARRSPPTSTRVNPSTARHRRRRSRWRRPTAAARSSGSRSRTRCRARPAPTARRACATYMRTTISTRCARTWHAMPISRRRCGLTVSGSARPFPRSRAREA
nr:phage integrase family protein [Burkholderia sp. BCC0322]